MPDRRPTPTPPPPAQPSRQASQLLRSSNDPRWNWTRARTTRRLLVVGFLASLGVYAASLSVFADELAATGYPSTIGVLPLAVVWFFAVGLWQATRGVLVLRDRNLDERQRQVRDRAFRRAYWLTLAIVAVIALAVQAAPITPHGDQWDAITLPTFLLVLLLPTMTVAWTEPDEPAAES